MGRKIVMKRMVALYAAFGVLSSALNASDRRIRTLRLSLRYVKKGNSPDLAQSRHWAKLVNFDL
jgi:hypothetical protein